MTQPNLDGVPSTEETYDEWEQSAIDAADKVHSALIKLSVILADGVKSAITAGTMRNITGLNTLECRCLCEFAAHRSLFPDDLGGACPIALGYLARAYGESVIELDTFEEIASLIIDNRYSLDAVKAILKDYRPARDLVDDAVAKQALEGLLTPLGGQLKFEKLAGLTPAEQVEMSGPAYKLRTWLAQSLRRAEEAKKAKASEQVELGQGDEE